MTPDGGQMGGGQTGRLQLRHLRAVAAIATHGSLLRAAASLGVSQPALTKTLQDAEAMAGARLFDRKPRGTEATPAGLAVARTAQAVRAELARLADELAGLAGLSGGTLVLGALPTAMAGVLPGTLARLKALHPGLTVQLVQGRTEELLPGLLAGEIDLVVGRLYPPLVPDGLQREPLYDEPFAVLARSGHTLLRERPEAADDLDASALDRFGLILPTVSQRAGVEIDRLLAAMGRSLEGAMRASSATLIREMLHTTDMIAVAPALAMSGDLLRGTIGRVPVRLPTLPRPAGVIRVPNRPLSAAGQALLTCLRAHLREVAQAGLVAISFTDTASATNDKTPAANQG